MNKINFKKELSYQVSNIDLMHKVLYPKKTKIIVYSELANVNDITELLPTSNSVVFILLKEDSTAAHWTVLTRVNNSLYYFDSYGVEPDGELKNITSEERDIFNESTKYLTQLLYHSSFDISYNTTQFQQYSNATNTINTCGRWCLVFANCIFSGLNLSMFKNRMLNIKKQTGLSYDKLICVLYDSF